MEGSKPFEAKPQPAESELTAEKIAESVERAKDLFLELQPYNNVEMIGAEAMALNTQAEELSAELTLVLKNIPAKDCLENGLPYHPSDEKPKEVVTPFPAQPDYPTDYIPTASSDHATVDQEQIV